MEPAADIEHARSGLLSGLTRNVFVLGAVSLFTDISSEMLVPIRFLFLVYTLGTPVTIAGLIEGIAESASSILKVISGRLADRWPQRKPLILAGYGLSNAVKPLLAFVLSWPAALGLIVLDRFGKGIRGSPRDAVLADSTDPEHRGKAFGFHRAMDTLGAAIGPLCTVAILNFSGVDLRPVFAWAIVPGALSVVVLILFLHERRRETRAPAAPRPVATRSAWQKMADLGAPFWAFTCVATLFGLANSSDAFIFLRTQGIERSLEAVPLVYFGFNVVYALLSTPLGHLSDRIGRVPTLLGGYVVFALVYLGWARANQGWNVWVLFLFYGVYAAATEGVGKAFVSDLIDRSQRGTALGLFNGIVGFAALPANLLGGWLWSQYGPSSTFTVDALIAGGAAILFNILAVIVPGMVPDDTEPVVAKGA